MNVNKSVNHTHTIAATEHEGSRSHRSCECRASPTSAPAPAPDWYQLANGFCRFAIKNIVLYARFAFYLPAYIVVIVFVIPTFDVAQHARRYRLDNTWPIFLGCSSPPGPRDDIPNI